MFTAIFGIYAKGGSNVGDNKWSLGMGLEFLDFYSPMDHSKFRPFSNPNQFGPKVQTWYNPNSSIGVTLDLGSYIRGKQETLTVEDDDTTFVLGPVKKIIGNAAVGLVYKFNNGYILKETFPVAPYLYTKLQLSVDEDYAKGFSIPIGGGVNWKLANNVALNTYMGYNIGVKNIENNVNIGMGVLFDLGKGKFDEEPVVIEEVVEAPKDTDGDGIIDANDDCPEVAGLAAFNGCPDTDGDGIADKNDNCPTLAGLAQYNGCPDTDGDGITDNVDKCPNEKGIARLAGCPEPDTDKDGIIDINDKCPNVFGIAALQGCPDRDGDGIADGDDRCPDKAGPASNKGCPEIKEEAKKKLEMAISGVKFETGKATLKAESYKVLDDVVAVLKEWSDYSVRVEGHTDNTGDETKNIQLSKDRAKVCADYLILKGISASRVSWDGFGSSRPKADNKTAEGRAKNRRTEFVPYIK
jgi:outer membrane protein OmpA-like peptidoglycan-associated protein